MGSVRLSKVIQLHKDVPKAAEFYSKGLDFTLHLCSLRWAHLQSGPFHLALLEPSSSCDGGDAVKPKSYSSLLSFTVPDLHSTVTKLLSLGAELDGPVKNEIYGKVAALRCLDGHMIGLYEPL